MWTLVLIPGLACDARVWQAQTSALARFSPVVTDATQEPPSIEAMAARLLAAHPGDLVLCGTSMGGMVAMEAARQAPARVRGLALVGTYAHPETDAMRAVREAAIVLFESGRAEEVVRPNIAFAFSPVHQTDTVMTGAYLRIVLEAGGATLARQNRAVMARPDARQHLPSLRCPTLVVVGADDALAPPDSAREIARLVPQAELHVLPDCGHMVTMEQPQALNALLADWLGRLPAA